MNNSCLRTRRFKQFRKAFATCVAGAILVLAPVGTPAATDEAIAYERQLRLRTYFDTNDKFVGLAGNIAGLFNSERVNGFFDRYGNALLAVQIANDIANVDDAGAGAKLVKKIEVEVGKALVSEFLDPKLFAAFSWFEWAKTGLELFKALVFDPAVLDISLNNYFAARDAGQIPEAAIASVRAYFYLEEQMLTAFQKEYGNGPFVKGREGRELLPRWQNNFRRYVRSWVEMQYQQYAWDRIQQRLRTSLPGLQLKLERFDTELLAMLADLPGRDQEAVVTNLEQLLERYSAAVTLADGALARADAANQRGIALVAEQGAQYGELARLEGEAAALVGAMRSLESRQIQLQESAFKAEQYEERIFQAMSALEQNRELCEGPQGRELFTSAEGLHRYLGQLDVGARTDAESLSERFAEIGARRLQLHSALNRLVENVEKPRQALAEVEKQLQWVRSTYPGQQKAAAELQLQLAAEISEHEAALSQSRLAQRFEALKTRFQQRIPPDADTLDTILESRGESSASTPLGLRLSKLQKQLELPDLEAGVTALRERIGLAAGGGKLYFYALANQYRDCHPPNTAPTARDAEEGEEGNPFAELTQDQGEALAFGEGGGDTPTDPGEEGESGASLAFENEIDRDAAFGPDSNGEGDDNTEKNETSENNETLAFGEEEQEGTLAPGSDVEVAAESEPGFEDLPVVETASALDFLSQDRARLERAQRAQRQNRRELQDQYEQAVDHLSRRPPSPTTYSSTYSSLPEGNSGGSEGGSSGYSGSNTQASGSGAPALAVALENINRILEERHQQRLQRQQANGNRASGATSGTSVSRSNNSGYGSNTGRAIPCRDHENPVKIRRRIQTVEKNIRNDRQLIKNMQYAIQRYPNAFLDHNGSWLTGGSREGRIRDARARIPKHERELANLRRQLSRARKDCP